MPESPPVSVEGGGGGVTRAISPLQRAHNFLVFGIERSRPNLCPITTYPNSPRICPNLPKFCQNFARIDTLATWWEGNVPPPIPPPPATAHLIRPWISNLKIIVTYFHIPGSCQSNVFCVLWQGTWSGCSGGGGGGDFLSSISQFCHMYIVVLTTTTIFWYQKCKCIIMLRGEIKQIHITLTFLFHTSIRKEIIFVHNMHTKWNEITTTDLCWLHLVCKYMYFVFNLELQELQLSFKCPIYEALVIFQINWIITRKISYCHKTRLIPFVYSLNKK